MKYIKTDITTTITKLRSKLYERLTAPIDAMWELLYIASSQHYHIENDHQNIGYCCIDEGGSLLQIFLKDEHVHQMDKAIATLIESGVINSAKLSSSASIAFNLCLFYSKSIQPNTLCYEHSNKIVNNDSSLTLELASQEDIPAIKTYLKEQLGMDDTFGYTQNLVARKELFLIKEANVIIATSECRLSDSQPEVADLGIIVNKDHQGKGIATQVMKMQVNRVLAANRKPICSTTVDNIASRKAIEKSGFYYSNIIFDILFTDQ